MMKRSVLCLTVISLCMASGLAQSRRKRPSRISSTGVVTDIRGVDFLNFAYHPSLYSQEFLEVIGKTVRVRNGKFKNKDAYFDVVDNIYGDVTGEGRDEAIIHIACGSFSSLSGFYISEIFIYTVQNGRATLLVGLSDNDMRRDYSHYYPGGELRRITDDGIKIRNGNLVIERFAEGSMAMPDYIVALEYRWSGETLSLSRKPQRRGFRQ